MPQSQTNMTQPLLGINGNLFTLCIYSVGIYRNSRNCNKVKNLLPNNMQAEPAQRYLNPKITWLYLSNRIKGHRIAFFEKYGSN
jgi:hypothetical protein